MTKRILESRSINSVLDFGAWNGHSGKFLRQQVGFAGMIFSFEP